jgi:cyanate permease
LRADVKLFGDAASEFSSGQIRSTFLDWKVWLYMVINFGSLTPVFCLSSFLPSIIEQMGYENAQAQLLSVPPYVMSCVTTILIAWNAGPLNERSNHLLLCLVLAMSGFLHLILAERHLYFGACLASIGVFSAYALVPSWVTNNISGQKKRAVAVGLVTAAGSLGGILSGQIYRESKSSSYRQGHLIVLGILCVTFLNVLVMKFSLTYLNRRRRRLMDCANDERQPLRQQVTLFSREFFFFKIELDIAAFIRTLASTSPER